MSKKIKNMDIRRKIRLFPNCIPVRGVNRATICDLYKNEVVFVPNSLVTILEMSKSMTIEELYNKNIKSTDIIESYFLFLHEQKFIYFVKEERDELVEFVLEWDFPSLISNAVIDISKNNEIYVSKIIKELSLLGCRHCQIRFFSKDFDIQFYIKMLTLFNQTSFLSIDLVIPFSSKMRIEQIGGFKRLSNVIIYSSGFSENRVVEEINCIYTDINYTSSKYCGCIKSSFFAVNINTFTESQHHNTCLNRKISIDTDGNIKNCPLMAQSFGNIADTTLAEALAHPDFKKYWNVKKDQISVCQDCEFRHICTDCRAYLENPEDMYSKPLKCGYNPYTCEWEEWSTNPLKQKAIAYYGMEEIL